MRTAIGLGFRAALSGAGRGRFVMFALVGAVACACFLAVPTAAAVKAREDDRVPPAAEAGLGPAVPPRAYATLAPYRGRAVTLVLVAAGDGAPVPPGLGEPLRPGEARLSPALASRVDDDPILAGWFPYTRLDDLPPAAVGAAGEYKAYIGVTPSALAGIHAPTDYGFGRASPFGYYQALGFLLFAGLPGIGLLAVSSRFGRRIRRERFAALRLLGMPARHCRVALGIETGLPTGLGAGVVALTAATVRPDHVVVPLVERWVFGEDARLGAAPLVGIAAAVAVLGAAFGATTPHQRAATGRVRTLVARADVTRAWTVALYLGGVAALGWAWVRAEPADPWRFVGVLLAGAGIPGAVAVATKVGASLTRGTSGPVAWFLAMRKLRADPRSLTRLAGLVGIVVFTVGVAEPIAQVIAVPASTWVAEATDAGRTTVLGRSEDGPAPLVLSGPPPAGTVVAVPEVGLWGPGDASEGRFASALVGSCDEVATLLDGEVGGCDDGSIQRIVEPSEPPFTGTPPGAPLDVRAVDGSPLTQVTVPTSEMTGSSYDENVPLPALRIPPALLPEAALRYDVGVYVRTEASAEAWERVQAWVTGSSPFYRAVNEFDALAGNDTTGTWIVLGSSFAALIAAFGAALTGFDEQRTAASEWAALRALGMASRGLVGVRLIIAAASALVAVVVALAPALLAADAFLRVNDDELTTRAPYAIAALTAPLVVLAITLASATLQMRRLTPCRPRRRYPLISAVGGGDDRPVDP